MDTEVLTARLRLREWRPDDLEALTSVFAQPEVWYFPYRRGFTTEESKNFLTRMIDYQDRGLWCPLVSEERSTARLLGYIGLSEPHFLPEIMPSVEIGWRLDPSAWRLGLATEGARAILDQVFAERELHEVVSIYEPDNVASGNVMVRLGMQLDRETHHPESGDALRVFRLSRERWAQRGGDDPTDGDSGIY